MGRCCFRAATTLFTGGRTAVAWKCLHGLGDCEAWKRCGRLAALSVRQRRVDIREVRMATIHENSRDQSASSTVQDGAGDAAPGWEFIAAQMRDGLCWLSAAGELLRINASTTRITGFALDECRRHAHFPADLVIDEDRPTFNQFVVRTQQGREGAELVVRIRRSDAAIIWVSIL